MVAPSVAPAVIGMFHGRGRERHGLSEKFHGLSEKREAVREMFHGCWCDHWCDHLVRPNLVETILKNSELSVRCKRCHLTFLYQFM